MLAPQEESTADVRREDQIAINRFARLNARGLELGRERAALQKQLDLLEDASTDLMMAESETIWLEIGEAFFATDDAAAGEHCEALVEQLQAKMAAGDEEQAAIEQEQAQLKALLYGRFGKSINLETS